jgi:DNA-binding response OmpR family regulator
MDSTSKPFKVLAVDDSAIYRKLVEHSLSAQEYEVLFAKSGREALDLFAEHEPAVVITDWSMPDIGGLELCRRIRRDFQGFHSHLILLTSNSDKEQVVEGLAAGADDYLTKPFHAGELVARVSAAAQRAPWAKVKRSLIGCGKTRPPITSQVVDFIDAEFVTDFVTESKWAWTLRNTLVRWPRVRRNRSFQEAVRASAIENSDL